MAISKKCQRLFVSGLGRSADYLSNGFIRTSVVSCPNSLDSFENAAGAADSEERFLPTKTEASVASLPAKGGAGGMKA